jgi:hypothetical protein
VLHLILTALQNYQNPGTGLESPVRMKWILEPVASFMERNLNNPYHWRVGAFVVFCGKPFQPSKNSRHQIIV